MPTWLDKHQPTHRPALIACNGFDKFGAAFSEDYCWTQGLYTVKEAYDLLSVNVPYPGLEC